MYLVRCSPLTVFYNSSDLIMNHLIYKIGNNEMRFEICYQCDEAQYNFDKSNPEVIYCFGEKALKQAKLISEAKKYGSGVLFVVNGKNVLEQICF